MADDMLLFTAGSLGRLVRRIVNRNLRSIGITSAQISALIFIENNNGASQKEIEEELNLTRATVSAMTDSLEAMELAVREKDFSDARVRRIVITEKGRTLLARAKKLMDETEDALRSAISEEEKATYIAICHRFKNILEESLC